jgi:hypothetical protein
MSAPVVLHIAGERTEDGVDCCRCGAVLAGVQSSAWPAPGVVVLLPTGHFTSAHVAGGDARRSGTLCEAKRRGENTTSINGVPVLVRTWLDRDAIVTDGLAAAIGAMHSRDIMARSEAIALCQALKLAIDEAERREPKPRATEFGDPVR